MVNWNTVMGTSMAIAGSVMVIAVLAIVLGAFKNTNDTCPSGYVYNSSGDVCNKAANASDRAPFTIQGNITQRGLTFLDNATSKFSTAGTILGVLLLLGLVVGGGVMGYKKFNDR